MDGAWGAGIREEALVALSPLCRRLLHVWRAAPLLHTHTPTQTQTAVFAEKGGGTRPEVVRAWECVGVRGSGVFGAGGRLDGVQPLKGHARWERGEEGGEGSDVEVGGFGEEGLVLDGRARHKVFLVLHHNTRDATSSRTQGPSPQYEEAAHFRRRRVLLFWLLLLLLVLVLVLLLVLLLLLMLLLLLVVSLVHARACRTPWRPRMHANRTQDTHTSDAWNEMRCGCWLPLTNR
eukprot:690817-Rhodomonas_salina.1